MKRTLLWLLVFAALAPSACRTAVPEISCNSDDDCDPPISRCRDGVCVHCAPAESLCPSPGGDGGEGGASFDCCLNGVDDDCDGLVDCEDEECVGLVCRDAAGPCDLAETCQAGSADCPPDVHLGPDIVCSAPTTCGAEARCTGDSADCPAPAPANQGVVCREAAGPCEEPAACDGVSNECPENPLKAPQTVCRPVGPDEGCLQVGRCDGLQPDCPPSGLVPAGEVCRVAAQDCEEDATCDGTSPRCPPNPPAPRGTPCRPAADVCDEPESCDGQNPACPPDAVVPASAGVECRPAAGACDRPDLCDGSGPACPADAKWGSQRVCGVVEVGVCEVAARCDGVNDACPPNEPAPSGTVCRPAAGPCDVAEVCPGGGSRACPPDKVTEPNTPCRLKADACDLPESCDGLSPHCPEDAFVEAGAVCRPPTGACRGPALCSGTGPECPPNPPIVGVCAEATLPCMLDAVCDAADTACPPPGLKPAGTLCGARKACEAQVCSGSQFDCPESFSVLPAGTPCGLSGETCDGVSRQCPLGPRVSTGSGGWFWENPRPQGNTLRGASGLASGEVWLVGDLGVVLHWVPAPAPAFDLQLAGGAGTGTQSQAQARAINAVSIADTGEGWAVGDRGLVLRKASATADWVEVMVPQLAAEDVLGVAFFPAAQEVFVCTGSGSIWRGPPAPSAWSMERSGTGRPLRALWGSSPTDLWAVGDGPTVLRRDTNQAWAPVPCTVTVSGGPQAVSGWGPGSAVVIATDDPLSPILLASAASGCAAATGLPQAALRSVKMFDEQTGWAVGDLGAVLRMTGGVWEEVPVDFGIPDPLPPHLYAVWGRSADDVWAAGAGGATAHLTADPGSPSGFQVLTGYSASSADLRGVTGATGAPGNASEVFVAGAQSTLLHRQAGWEVMRWNTGLADFVAIAAAAAGDIFAVGSRGMLPSQGAIARCDGGTNVCADMSDLVPGQSWRGVGAHASALTLAGTVGCVQIPRSGDTFLPWTPLLDAPANAVYASPAGGNTDVWLVGDGGAIHRGSIPVPSPVSASLLAVTGYQQAGQHAVLAVGANGTMVASDDGAAFYPGGAIGVEVTLRGVWADAQGWVAVGDGGFAAIHGVSASGGWTGTAQRLNAVWGETGAFWAVGDRGVILWRPRP